MSISLLWFIVYIPAPWFIARSLVQFFTAHYTWYARYYQSGALNKSYLGHADQDEKTAAALVVHHLMDTLSGKVCGGGVWCVGVVWACVVCEGGWNKRVE